jgi:uncharacterized membrane protein YqjE
VNAAAASDTAGATLEPPQADLGERLEPGLVDNAAALWGDLKGLAHDHLELAALETRRAGESLVWIIACGILVALLAATAWMGLVTALVLWLITTGWAPALAVLAGVGGNLLAAALGIAFIRWRAEALRFPATVRALRPVSPDQGSQAMGDRR